MDLTLADARTLLLAAQGLLARPSHPPSKADVLETIRRMGALQLDTIQVVARSPYLVLWSRLGGYEPRWLDELLAEGALFEYWSHAACLLPIEDYPLYLGRMRTYGTEWGWSSHRAWMAEHPDELERMLALVRERGPVRSADFAAPEGHVGGWWGWKPDKRALEILHSSGALMIARRTNFQRVYDLRERVLPSWHQVELEDEEVRRRLARKAIRALGIARTRWVPDYFRTPQRGTIALLESLADEGALLRAKVEGWKDVGYVHPAYVDLLQGSLPTARLTTLLSPFDPLVWHRERARALFGFDYAIECYTPAPKRRYGYFTLPILRRGALVGRLDPKAHRKARIFEVKALYLEPGVAPTEELVADLAGALLECAAWHKTPEVVVSRSEPPELATLVGRAVEAVTGDGAGGWRDAARPSTVLPP